MNAEKLEVNQVINAVQDLQYDMQQWIRGEIEKNYELISDRQATDLTVISSKGIYQTRTDFNERYEIYYGKYPKARLTADILRTKRLSDEMILVVYKQYSELGEKKLDRITTAIFRYKEGLKNSSEWVHVHVTKADE